MSSRPSKSGGNPRRAPRQRPLPPDVTARNLAIEKKRRGELNDTFLDLARLVPALAPARRLSKVLILTAGVHHFRQQRDMCVSAAQDMQDLLAENSRLVSEVNAMRSQIWGSEMTPCEPKLVTQAMSQLIGTKDQVYGDFPAGFGDNWACNNGGSESPTALGFGVEDEEASPPLNNLYTTQAPSHTQAPSQSELAEFPTASPALILAPDVQIQNSWAFDTPLTSHVDPLPSSNPEQFIPTDAPFGNYTPAPMTDYIPGLLEPNALDNMMRSWACNVDFGLDPTFMPHDVSDHLELGSVI